MGSFAKERAWLLRTSPVLGSCVTLGKSLPLSEPQMKTAALQAGISFLCRKHCCPKDFFLPKVSVRQQRHTPGTRLKTTVMHLKMHFIACKFYLHNLY